MATLVKMVLKNPNYKGKEVKMKAYQLILCGILGLLIGTGIGVLFFGEVWTLENFFVRAWYFSFGIFMAWFLRIKTRKER